MNGAPNKWLVALSVSFGALMGAVDASIINVALPRIQGTLGATVQEITWVSTGYAIALVNTFVHDDVSESTRTRAALERGNADVIGISLLSVALGFGQFVIEEGPERGFDDWTIMILLALAAIAFVFFVMRERSIPAPAVNLSLFRDRTFALGVAVNALTMAMLLASIFLQPLFLEELIGQTPFQSGFALPPRSLPMMLALVVVGGLYEKLPPRATVAVGITMFALGGLDLSHLTLASGAGDMMRATALQGIGIACVFVPLETLALANVPREHIADATGLNNLLTETGGAVGVAMLASFLERHTAYARNAIASHLNPRLAFEHLAILEKTFEHVSPGNSRGIAIAVFDQEVERQAAAIAFDHAFFISGIACLLALPLLFFLRAPKTLHDEAA